MTLLFIRIFFLSITTFAGYYVGSAADYFPLLGISLGFGIGLLMILLELSLRRVSVRGLSSMVFGLLLGIFMAKLVADILTLLPLGDYVQSVSRVALTLTFSYLGAVMALRGKDDFHVIIPYVRFKRQDMEERMILLDTSAIIDGRVKDIYKTNFLVGRLVVPRFVLQELQRLADSRDAQKRQRGRRGMDLLRDMQKDSSLDVIIHEDDIPGGEDVDSRLVRLAKIMDARICTTDYNLSRAALIQGVRALNINELVDSIKKVLFPGEEMTVRLVKEGKEPAQAIAYAEDGTMIVVSDARALIGKTVKVTIASVLQTQAGQMIFAKLSS